MVKHTASTNSGQEHIADSFPYLIVALPSLRLLREEVVEGGVWDVLHPLLLPPATELLVSSSGWALLVVVLRVLEMREGETGCVKRRGQKEKGYEERSDCFSPFLELFIGKKPTTK